MDPQAEGHEHGWFSFGTTVLPSALLDSVRVKVEAFMLDLSCFLAFPPPVARRSEIDVVHSSDAHQEDHLLGKDTNSRSSCIIYCYVKLPELAGL